ncbi:MAG: ethanolamine ammonia-lyase subunit EutC [Acidobacteriaceae bacterium]|nr:ethanolamine ammonia-lyase subunit EutC [Acidobacteriaceae bacterium]
MADWQQLKCFTPARVALGRTGASLPTEALLDFDLAHARARDAVHAVLHVDQIAADIKALGWPSIRVHSAAGDRAEYLRRPDLGRRLQQTIPRPFARPPELLFVVADGLSALAAERHAVPLLAVLRPNIASWRVGPVMLAEQARVALGDAIGESLGAEIVVMLIGERPGLSAPDSLGAYITYGPRVGRSDAERNCLSNIRPQGLTYELAAHRLLHLLEAARGLRLTGVALKDQSRNAPATLTLNDECRDVPEKNCPPDPLPRGGN